MAWQINESAFLWGDFVDSLIDTNAHSYDKNGKHDPKYDISAVLGLKQDAPRREGPQSRREVMELEVREFDPRQFAGKPSREQFDPRAFMAGDVIVDAPTDDQLSRRQYADPAFMAEISRPGGKIRTRDEVT